MKNTKKNNNKYYDNIYYFFNSNSINKIYILRIKSINIKTKIY